MYETTAVNINECSYCGWTRIGVCPRIEEIEYYPDGTIKRVKLRSDIYITEIEETPIYEGNGHICGKDCPQTVW